MGFKNFYLHVSIFQTEDKQSHRFCLIVDGARTLPASEWGLTPHIRGHIEVSGCKAPSSKSSAGMGGRHHCKYHHSRSHSRRRRYISKDTKGSTEFLHTAPERT